MNKRYLLLVFSVFFSLNLEASENIFLIGKGRVGKLKLGSSIDSLYGVFEKDGPLTLSDKYLEASFTPIVQVHAKDKELVMDVNVVIEGGKFAVGPIEIFSPKFFTAKNVRVGTSYEELTKLHTQIELEHFHGSVFATLKDEKLSFTLDFPVEKWPAEMNFKNSIPGSTKIKSVVITR